MTGLLTPRPMVRTLRALAWLLRYPDATLRLNLEALRAALHDECALDGRRLAELDLLIDNLRDAPALAVEARYVDLFDRGRRTALCLFEHVHGDSRDRGAAMVDLAMTYERAGLRLSTSELPDYLPVALEFASTQPVRSARAFLGEFAHIVRGIFSALLDRRSRYASVLAAILDLAGERAERVALTTEPSIDESWEEPPVFGGCSSQGQARPDAPQPIHFARRRANPPTGAAA